MGNDTDNLPPGGWYPDREGRMRYWDGTAWTDQVQGVSGAGTAPTATMASAKASRPWFKKKRWLLSGGAVALIVLIGAIGAGAEESQAPVASEVQADESEEKDAKPASDSKPKPEPTKKDPEPKPEPDPEPKKEPEPKPEPEPEPAPEPEPEEPALSGEAEQAARSAENYISMTGFSKTGLIEQLEFEGYGTQAATQAVNSMGINWKEQAARSAENYLDMTGFSRSGLIDQLMFEGYTRPQAEYGATQVGL